MRRLGAVLAGGQARRFGSDKALAPFDGRPLIAHAAAAVGAHVDTVVVCGRAWGGLPTLADRPTAGLGPLGGLAAALHHAATHGYAGVLATGCDMPRFPAALAAALVGEGASVLAGQRLAGWWPAALSARLDAHLADGSDRSMRGWMAVADAREVAAGDIAMPNVNTPEDLAALVRGDG